MKSKKLKVLGRNRAFKSHIDWLAERYEQEIHKPNDLRLEFPHWHESDTRAKALAALKADPSALAEGQALEAEYASNPDSEANAFMAELSQFAEAARTLGIGKANIAIALTQILNEFLIEGRTPKGLPAIRGWKDISTILHTIAIAESSLELWAECIGFNKIRHLIQISSDE
jgi:hypothetical protein